MAKRISWHGPSGGKWTGLFWPGFGWSFSVVSLLGKVYRLDNPLPVHGIVRDRDRCFASPEEAMERAEQLVEKFFATAAVAVNKHPVHRVIDKATMFVFRDQLCNEQCAFYGGTDPHEDITLERIDDLGWTITRPGGQLYTKTQKWAVPDTTLDQPASERFLWDLEEALDHIHGFHCG